MSRCIPNGVEGASLPMHFQENAIVTVEARASGEIGPMHRFGLPHGFAGTGKGGV
jgi:hypothetical protein